MRSDRPSGTVTFLFTDVEGSTRLLHSLGAETYAEALTDHRRLIRDACVPGFALESWMKKDIDEQLALVHAGLDDAAFDATWEEGVRMSLDEAVALALGEAARDAWPLALAPKEPRSKSCARSIPATSIFGSAKPVSRHRCEYEAGRTSGRNRGLAAST
jgi:hypothetical protein